eukprot:43897-Eustigmatos_ZCMA.PRE.1
MGGGGVERRGERKCVPSRVGLSLCPCVSVCMCVCESVVVLVVLLFFARRPASRAGADVSFSLVIPATGGCNRQRSGRRGPRGARAARRDAGQGSAPHGTRAHVPDQGPRCQ